MFLSFGCISLSVRTITPIKIKSYLSISFSYSAVGLTTIILVLLTSAILTSVTAYAQIFTFPNTHSDITSTTTDTHSRLSALQQQQASQPNLHLVKITSPIKGQQVTVGKKLEIFGISADNATTSGCTVSVEVNGVNPYHNVSRARTSGHIDYSKWNFTLTPVYTLIKPGQNKITAKFSCSDKPTVISHYSVNVTGVVTRGGLNSTTTHPVSSNATHPVSSMLPILFLQMLPILFLQMLPILFLQMLPILFLQMLPILFLQMLPILFLQMLPILFLQMLPILFLQLLI